MNKIEQILQIKLIDGAKQIKQIIERWSNSEVIQFYKELELVNKTDLLPKCTNCKKLMNVAAYECECGIIKEV